MPVLSRVREFPSCCWNCGHRVFLEGEPCCRSPEVLSQVTAEYPELRDAAGRIDMAAFDDLLDADVDTVCNFHVKEKEMLEDGTTVTIAEAPLGPRRQPQEVRGRTRQDLQEADGRYKRFRRKDPQKRPKSALGEPG